MRSVADFLIAVANLVEVEGKVLRRSVMRLLIGCLLVLVSLIFVFCGFAMLTWCVYVLGLKAAGPALAALLAGLFALVVSGVLVGVAKWTTS